MPPLRTDDALGPQLASVRWASGTTEFCMPGLPRGADHIDWTGGIPEYGSFLPQSSRALEPTLTFSGPSSAGFANDIMSAPYCSAP